MNIYCFNWILSLLWTYITVSCSQTFTSLRDVELLFDEEGRLTRALKRYIDTSIKNGTEIDDEVIRFHDKTDIERSSVNDTKKWVEHPVNSFRLLNRVVYDWEKVFKNIFCDDCQDTYAGTDLKISRKIAINALQSWPTRNDVTAAVKAILRLWRTYELDLGQLFNGTILQSTTNPLTSQEIITIGRKAIDADMHYEGISWLTSLLEVGGHSVDDEEDISGSVRRSIASAYYKAGMPSKAVEILDQGDVKERGKNYNFYKSRATDESRRKKGEVKLLKYPKYFKAYEALCRGNLKSTKQQAKLRCFMKKTKMLFYEVKAELVNHRPIVIVYHDVISENETKFIREKGRKYLDDSKIYSDEDTVLLAEEIRVSQTAWLVDREYPQLLRLNKRIAAITGLDTTYNDHLTSVEPYQVQIYGVGGMYTPHRDILGRSLWDKNLQYDGTIHSISGERIATWMFYLNTVEAGGATVFPILKARVPATQGSAVFWYNTLPNGKADRRMVHAGCPVLLGSKWVVNKWILQHGQVLSTLCGEKQDSDFSINDI